MELGNMIFGNSRGSHSVDRGMQDEWFSYMEELGFDGYGYHDLSDERGIFENDVFRIQPYYWGDCECHYEEKKDRWSKENSHRAECYQTELRGRLRTWEIENGYDAVKSRAYGNECQFFGAFDVTTSEPVPGVTLSRMTARTDADMKALNRLDRKRGKAEDAIMDELCARHGLDRRFGCAVHCTCDYRERLAAFSAANDHAPDCRIATPNFTHKPSGFTLEWYKYPLRDSYSNAPLTRKLMRSMWADCRASFASAMSAGTAETPQEAQGEARQRGGEAETPKEHRP